MATVSFHSPTPDLRTEIHQSIATIQITQTNPQKLAKVSQAEKASELGRPSRILIAQ